MYYTLTGLYLVPYLSKFLSDWLCVHAVSILGKLCFFIKNCFYSVVCMLEVRFDLICDVTCGS